MNKSQKYMTGQVTIYMMNESQKTTVPNTCVQTSDQQKSQGQQSLAATLISFLPHKLFSADDTEQKTDNERYREWLLCTTAGQHLSGCSAPQRDNICKRQHLLDRLVAHKAAQTEHVTGERFQRKNGKRRTESDNLEARGNSNELSGGSQTLIAEYATCSRGPNVKEFLVQHGHGHLFHLSC
jgi:hypothetical protein